MSNDDKEGWFKSHLGRQYWAFFRGYICTANVDGSIPLNSITVMDCRFANANEALRIVDIHNDYVRAQK